MEQIAEANVLAEKTGLGIKPMQQLLQIMFPQPPHTIFTQRMISGVYHRDEVRDVLNEYFQS